MFCVENALFYIRSIKEKITIRKPRKQFIIMKRSETSPRAKEVKY